jgi:pyrroloquinoline quinone (PQQ) biosynthesis protein C
MIAGRLKAEIETYASRLDRADSLLAAARRGEVTVDMVQAYLNGILYNIGHTVRHLALAAQRAREVDRPDLARYFEHKIGEEQGHDKWAQNDLGALGRSPAAASAEAPRACVELIAFLDQSIVHAPASYLAYILFAEYFTVLVGPAWIAALEQHCGIPRSALTVVANHVELDEDHVQEGLREIDALVTEADAPGLFNVLLRAMGYYDAFYASLLSLHARSTADRAAT